MKVAKSLFAVSQLELNATTYNLPAPIEELVDFWNKNHREVLVLEEEIKDVVRPKKTRKSVSK